MKLSFCLQATKSLHDSDLATLTESIEHYQRAGMSAEQAELAAVDDLMASVKAERDETVGLLREQHPDLFQSDRQPLPTPPKAQRILPIRGSDALGQISARLGGLSPKLLPDLSQQVQRTSKKGKPYTVWSNPPHVGYGPLFRAGGTADLSEVARVLEEQGYLTPGSEHPEQDAEAIVKAELNKGGSTLRVGDANSVEAEARRRQAMDDDFEASLPDDVFDHLVEQDLEESGYAEASPEVKAITEQLLADAEAAGIDVETIQETAARGDDEATQDEYHAKLQALLAESIQRLARGPEGNDAGAAEGSDRSSGEAAGGQEQGAGPTARDAGRAEPAGVVDDKARRQQLAADDLPAYLREQIPQVLADFNGHLSIQRLLDNLGDPNKTGHLISPLAAGQVIDELVANGTIERKNKSLTLAPVLSSQTEADLKAKTEREAKADELDQRAQIDAEAGQFSLEQQAAPEQRKDNTGDMFGGPSAEDVLRAKKTTKQADANPDQGLMFSLQEGDLQTDTPGFKHWSNNAPLISSKAAETHEFKTGERVVVEAYHGTKRPDRVGNRFKASRATSGPMAYHTSSPELASGYAQGKSDTSLANEDNDYPQWFKYKPKGSRSTVGIDRAWHFITPEQRAKIAELAPRVTYSEEQEPDGGNKIVLGPEGLKTGTGGYDQHIKEAKGNHLKALVEEWLNSGNLFDDEERFMQVLKLAGFPTKEVTFDSPNAEYPFVYKNYIAMQKPLVTSDIPQAVRDALDTAAKYDRTRAAQGSYGWEKNATTTRDWVKMFNENSTYAWTSIPDKVTKVLRGLGYDGIIDWSGKGGGQHHVPVYIPFEASQIKSAIGNKGTFDPLKGDIRLSQQDFQDTERLARPDVIEGDASPQDTLAIAKIQSEMRKRSPAFQSLQLTALPRLLKPGKDASEAAQQRYAAVDMAEKLFGKRVVFFTSNIAFANGLQADYLPGMIFVNEATTRPIQAVLGHELTHAMRQDQPALYNRLGDRIRTLLEEPGRYHEQLNARRAARGLAALSFDKLREELIADIVGDNFTDPKFWRDMTKGQPTLFARVLRVVKDFFDSLLAKLKNERPYGTDKYLNDVQAARDAVVEAMSAFAGDAKTAAQAVTTAAQANLSENEQDQTQRPEFKRWFGDSKVLDENGKPRVMYHGTADDFNSFEPANSKHREDGSLSQTKAIFVTSEHSVANEYATQYQKGSAAGGNVMPVYVKAEHPFDFDKATQRTALVDEIFKTGDVGELGDGQEALKIDGKQTLYTKSVLNEGLASKESNWTLMEMPEVQGAIKALGHDGFYVAENGHKNLGIYAPEQIKSATGNSGAFDASNPDIRASENNDPFYSELSRQVETAKMASAPAQGWKDWLKGLTNKGTVKADEVAWTGLEDFLDSRDGEISRDDVAAYLKANEVRFEALDRYSTGQSAEAVARNLFVSPTTVLRWLSFAGITRTPAETKGVTAEKRQQVIDLYESGLSVAKVAEQTGLGGTTVHRIVKGEGINRSLPEVRDTPADVKSKALGLYADGLNSYEVAEQTGVSQSTVAQWAVDAGISRGYSGAQALRAAQGRLTTTHGIKGSFESKKSGATVRADSLYEMARMGQLEADPSVASFERATDRIPYGEDHHYVPDLKVTYTDGHQVVEEIKPEHRLGDSVVSQKAEAGRAFYAEQGIDYRLVTERTIGLDGFDTVDVSKLAEEDQKRARQGLASTRWYLRRASADLDVADAAGDNHTTGGLPLFSLQFTPEEEAALLKAGINTRTRLQRAGDRIRLYYANATRAWTSNWARQFQQGALDQFTGINLAVRREIGALPTDQDPYVAARLANGGTSSVMRGLMLHGQARWAANGQHLEKIPGTEGLLDILKPLGPNLNQFFGWMIGQRAARLMREGRENNFTATDIAALQGLNKGHEAEFRTAALAYAAFKRSVLDVGEKAGLIDAEARKVWDNADYIPFYREIDDKAVFGATGKKGLAGQSSGIRTLKGGEAGLNDPMENILMNFSRLIDASLKNKALLGTIDVLTAAGSDIVHKVGYDMNRQIVPASQVKAQLKQAGTPDQIIDIIPPEAFEGMAKMWAIQAPTDPDVVRVMRGGKPEFYKVNDPLLLKALTSFVPFDFPGLGVARAFKRVLTSLVTKTPEFMARNWIRDTAATAIITRDGFHPLKSLTGVVKSYREAGAFEDLLFAGASFQTGDHNAGDPTATGKAMRRALRKKGFDASSASAFMSSIVDTPSRWWEHYLHVGEAIENGNREAVYEAAMKAGRGATAAAFESKDLMDFTLRGSSPMYQLLADVLPFFNARVQGLYRLGRADPKRVALYGTLMLVASLALALANGGNDDYDKLPDWDKETYWHFWIKGVHLRLPRPFELGVVFASIPERILRYAMGQDTGKKTLSRIVAMVRDQLAFDPVPQFIRPAVNAWANKDTFRDRPIENQGDEGKLPSQRYSKITSPTAIAATKAIAPLADEIGLSPKKLEYLVGGYLGIAGLYALGLSDMAIDAMSNTPVKPTRRLDQIPLLGTFYREEPTLTTVYETDLYKMRTEVDQIYKSVTALRKDNKPDEANQVAESHKDLLAARDALEHGGKALAEFNKKRDAIYANREMTKDQKREAIDHLLELRAKVSKTIMKTPAVVNAR